MTSPLPSAVLAAFSSNLSGCAQPGGGVLPCGHQAPVSLLSAIPCDLDSLSISASGEGDVPATLTLPGAGALIDVVCGVRPLANAGEGQSGGFQLKRTPAQISVTAVYAASCGQPGHPGLQIQPAGDDEAICKPQTIAGTQNRFEAFRRRTSVESSQQWVNGGPIFSVIRFLLACIEGEPDCGSVRITADSCGIRASGPCHGSLAATVRLHAEEVVELALTLPALGGVSRQTAGQSNSRSGEARVGDDGSFDEAPDGDTRSTTRRAQLGLGYLERNESQFTEGNRAAVNSDTFTTGSAFSTSAYTSGYQDGGAWSSERDAEHSGALSYLTDRGFNLALKYNGQSVGLDGVKDFLASCATVVKAINHFRALWEAGPGVTVSVGWRTTWQLEFMQVQARAQASRKLVGARLKRHREGSVSLTPVAGSATAAFGIQVRIERLCIEWLSIDLSAALTLSGTVTGSLAWTADQEADGEWSQAKRRKTVAGEAGLELKATQRVALLGRNVGCEIGVDSGLTAEGVLNPDCGGFESAKVALKPMVLTFSIWVGSTGEVDYVYEQPLFDGHTFCDFQP